MSAPEITVWVQPLGAGWTPIGADLGVELIPQSVTYERVRLGGSSTASFEVRRDTRGSWSDLGSFTPVLIELGGVKVWRGRIVGTPKKTGAERVWSVQCEGMYAHMNDDLTNSVFVKDGWAGWQDARQIPGRTTTLTGWSATGNVTNTDFGQATISFDKATQVDANGRVGLIYDAGPGNVIESIYLEAAMPSDTGDGSANLKVCSSTDGNTLSEETTVMACTASNTYSNVTTFATPRRYVCVYYHRSAATTYAIAFAIFLKEVRLAASSTYLTSGDSNVTLSDIVRSDLAACCPLISSDTTLLADTATAVPQFWPDNWATPRERLESLIAVDPSQFTILPETVPRAKITSIPTRPTWVYDAGTDGGSFDDAGANDGQEMFSGVVVPYTDSTGARADSGYTTESGSIAFTNGTFDVNATGWSATIGSVARVTTPVYAGAGSLQVTTGPAGDFEFATSSFSAALKPGRTYTVRFKARVNSGGVEWDELGIISNHYSGYTALFPSEQFVEDGWVGLTFTFVATVASLTLTFTAFGLPVSTAAFFVDSFEIELHGATLIDRRGFRRRIALQSDVSTSTAAAAHADAFLDTAQYPPFKGSLSLTGYARKYGTDESVPVGQIPDGEALLVYDDANPATGSVGRVGIIERVSYSHESQTAQIDLDSREDILDQIMLATRGLR